MATLFRGECNNGVHTLFAPAVRDVLLARYRMAQEYGWTSVNAQSALDTPHEIMTFVDKQLFEHKHARGYYTGTLADMDAWTDGHIVVPSDVPNFVPFSNGRFEEEREFIVPARRVIDIFELARPNAHTLWWVKRPQQ